MKRSELNQYVRDAAAFFAANHFMLPPYAGWTPDEWKHKGNEVDEVRARGLGWDVTDFHSGDFKRVGLTLFTLRNGSADSKAGKIYAEKIMYVRENQSTPYHYHVLKTEDIINRGGKGTGRLAVTLYNAKPGGGLADTPVTVSCDGIRHELAAGSTVFLGHGESITLTPYLYHEFHAVDGDALIGEVSSVNDDATDNYFLAELPRYPDVIEDQPPFRLLCNEYAKA